jgi:CDP-diacylglycerol--serine O-phosphatidyltransferase
MDAVENVSTHRGLRKGLYLIPAVFTAANAGAGFISVLASIRGFNVVAEDPIAAAGYFNYSAIAIGFALLFDMLDGRVARMTKTTTEIGVQFDSLADVLTFGIAPTALMYAWAIGPTFAESSPEHALGIFLLFMYMMCGVFRLARFNLQATRPRVIQEGTPKVDKKNFVGLPIPPAAGLLASIVHFAPAPLITYGLTSATQYTFSMMALFAVLGVLMVSTIRYSSFKSVGTGRRNFYVVLLIAGIGMLIWLYSKYMLLILSGVYVSHGIIWQLAGMLRPRKTAETESQS